MAGDEACPHEDLDITVNNQGFSDTNVHYLEIRATCKICQQAMRFRGMPYGVSPHHPTMSIDGVEVRLPFLPDGEQLSGKVIGFGVRRVK